MKMSRKNEDAKDPKKMVTLQMLAGCYNPPEWQIWGSSWWSLTLQQLLGYDPDV